MLKAFVRPLGIIMGAVLLYLLFRHEVKAHFGRVVISHELRDQF